VNDGENMISSMAGMSAEDAALMNKFHAFVLEDRGKSQYFPLPKAISEYIFNHTFLTRHSYETYMAIYYSSVFMTEKIYCAYFYAVKDHPNVTDDSTIYTLTSRARKAARKAAKAYEKCLELVTMGLARGCVDSVFPEWMVNVFYGNQFVHLEGDFSNSSMSISSTFINFMKQMPEPYIKDVTALMTDCFSYFPYANGWMIKNVYPQPGRVISLSPKTFVKVHNLVIKEIPFLFAGCKLSLPLAKHPFQSIDYFIDNSKKVEEYLKKHKVHQK